MKTLRKYIDIVEGSSSIDPNKKWFDDILDWHKAVDQIEYDRFESTTGKVFNGDELVASWDAGLHPTGPEGDQHWSNPRGWVKVEQDISEEATPEAIARIEQLSSK